MAGVRITVKTAAARRKIERVKAALQPGKIDPVVDRVAFQVQARLIRQTPKRWFGQVRRGWIVVKPRDGVRVVTNTNKVMLFLEEGTKAHGPREIFGPLQPGQPRKKKALFVPLTRRAATATAGVFGVGTTVRATRHASGAATLEKVRAIFQRTESVRKGKRKVGSRTLVYGTDYVLARRVRGIRALHIVRRARPWAKAKMLAAFKAHVRGAVRGKGG